MTRNLTIAGTLAAVVAVAAIASAVLAQQTPRLRVGGDGQIPAPRKTKHVNPVYPPEAKAEGIEGTVVLDIVISTEGKVIQTDVTKSAPPFDEAAVAAVSQWEYGLTMLNNEVVEVILSVTVKFALNEG
jgi:protein TonB